ncbi:MAG: alkaline phosphatase family protein [Vicinamibacteria bacterium]|nr:alkaline phosphatase family protein [Vicinamibacteria bacterium]
MKKHHFALILASLASTAFAQNPTRSVVVVTLDGLRWQEMFGGADEAYFKRDGKGGIDPASKKYAGDTPEARRALLMPFMWKVIAKEGQIFGDPSQQSRSHVTNGLWFSYPGYNEMLSGAADPRVDSNNKVPNPNVTVLEWLNRRPGFEGKVSAFGSWDVLPFILNTDRSRLPVGTGFVPAPDPKTAREREINQLAADLPPYWGYGTFDAPIVYAALEELESRKPRVLYIMLGEGDEWAHESRYDLYLDATRRADRFIERIWATLQSLPEYRDRTTLLVTTDHGRGATVKDWSDHGKDVPAAEDTWMAALGPAVPSLGVRKNLTVTTSQLAATIAAVVGEDFQAAMPKTAAGLPLR